MSFKLMAKAIEIKTGSPIAKLILLKLCDNANDAGICFPSQETIANQCEVSRETVNRTIKKLCEMGLVEKQDRVENNIKKTCRYVLKLDEKEVKSQCDAKSHRCDAESHIPVTQNHKEPIIESTTLKILSKKEQDKLRFEAFWKAYPKKLGRRVAEKSFYKAIKEDGHDAVKQGLISYYTMKQFSEDPQFIPMASTWLNQKRYLDKPEEMQNKIIIKKSKLEH